jgi:hypothetical protein
VGDSRRARRSSFGVIGIATAESKAFPRQYLAPSLDGGGFRRSFGKILMCMIVFEAALLGSGQMVQVGGITLKMFLFAIGIVYSAVCIFSGTKMSRGSVVLTVSLAALIALGCVNGLLHDADLKFIGEDVSPLLYFFILPFFEMTICTLQDLDLAIRMVLVGSLAMCAGFAVILAGLVTGRINAMALFGFLTLYGKGDFMYDGTGMRVFYKGFLYLGVAVIFFAFRRGLASKIGAAIALIMLFLTVTRGFVLALFCVGLLYAMMKPRRIVVKVGIVFATLLLAGIAIPVFFGLAGDRTESNVDRIVTIKQVVDQIDWTTPLIGHGFGEGVPFRPEHMEIAYLEIFHKEGLVGFLWLFAVLAVLALRFRGALRAGNANLAYPLFLAAAFVAFESLTNPFINNPIGLSVLMLSLAGLKVTAESDLSSLPAGNEERRLV